MNFSGTPSSFASPPLGREHRTPTWQCWSTRGWRTTTLPSSELAVPTRLQRLGPRQPEEPGQQGACCPLLLRQAAEPALAASRSPSRRAQLASTRGRSYPWWAGFRGKRQPRRPQEVELARGGGSLLPGQFSLSLFLPPAASSPLAAKRGFTSWGRRMSTPPPHPKGDWRSRTYFPSLLVAATGGPRLPPTQRKGAELLGCRLPLPRLAPHCAPLVGSARPLPERKAGEDVRLRPVLT